MAYFFNFDKMEYLHGKRPDGCIMCLIRDDSPDVEKLIVYKSEYFIVSLNLYPYNPGHLIVFPKRHVLDIRDYTKEEQEDVNRVTRLAMDVLDKTHKPVAFNLGYNMGRPAGASIEHVHLHIVPRFKNEIGIMEVIAGTRLLVQNPLDTQKIISEAFIELTKKD